MMKAEIKKILKIKVFILPLLFVIGYLMYSMLINGDFGSEYAVADYGPNGAWEAYHSVLKGFFSVVSLAAVAFVAPLFPYEKENNMTQVICIIKEGGDKFLYHKMKAMLVMLNAVLVILLFLVSVVHFVQYGFSGWDIRIQSSVKREFINTNLSCNMLQLVLSEIILGFAGCNALLLITTILSIVCEDSFHSLLISVAGNWILSYPVVHFAMNSDRLDLVLAVLPVNIAAVSVWMKAISSWGGFYCIVAIQLLILVILNLVLNKIWKTKCFYQKMR